MVGPGGARQGHDKGFAEGAVWEIQPWDAQGSPVVFWKCYRLEENVGTSHLWEVKGGYPLYPVVVYSFLVFISSENNKYFNILTSRIISDFHRTILCASCCKSYRKITPM